LRLAPFPPPAGVDPLSIATARPSCDADLAAGSKNVFAGLQAYVTAYEAHTTPLPAVAGFTITPHTASVDPSLPYYLELRPNFGGTGGGQRGEGPSNAGRGGFGGPGGPGGPGEGGPPGGGPPPGFGGASGQAAGGQAGGFARNANSPEFKAFRGFLACSYVSAWTSSEAKAKGIVTEGSRPGLFYVPKVGIVAVRPPELPQGGGSLKQAQ
jgi:hypothetical protein